MLHKQMLIDGAWVDARSGETIEVADPGNGEVFATVPSCGEWEIDRAVAAAKAAFPGWAAKTPFHRGAALRRAADEVIARRESIARLMSREQGKPYKEAAGEVDKGAEILRYYAEEGERVCGRIVPSADGTNIVSHVVYQPVGVAACISPWNYPIELLAWKVGAALTSGCACVLKVPSETPLCTIAFIEAVTAADIPAGVVNLITGSGRVVGNLLTGHPDVKKVAFTGSTAVGKTLMKNAADTVKRLSLELGGSLPMIVCADCDLEAAAAGATRRSFRNMGQICIAVNRVYVAREVYEPFLAKFAEKTRALTIGYGPEDDCDLGAMCTAKGRVTVEEQVADALKKGATAICGGKRPDGEKFVNGNFYEPTILRDVDHSMQIMQEETFGPAVGVMPFDTIDEAIALANDSCYGLAAIAFTKDLSLTARLARELNAGNVAVNNVDAGVINAPYGGWNSSGFGHEHGSEGLYEYLHIKHIRIKT